jgi:hypothetical protein
MMIPARRRLEGLPLDPVKGDACVSTAQDCKAVPVDVVPLMETERLRNYQEMITHDGNKIQRIR